jgi:hypothetical protein
VRFDKGLSVQRAGAALPSRRSRVTSTAPTSSRPDTQGYTKLLHVLGSNVAEFLQNLNNLHLHLSMGWPSMMAPAFRCEEVRARGGLRAAALKACCSRGCGAS